MIIVVRLAKSSVPLSNYIQNLFINIVLNKLVRLKKQFYFNKPLATTYIIIIFIISLSIRNCDG